MDAVNVLDRQSILAAVRQWAIASAAWQAEPDNAELEAAMNEAIAASDEAAAPVYAEEDLYYAIPEEEQQNDEVQTAYTALAALVASMQLAMEQPELPEDTGAPPDDDEIYEVLYGDLLDAPTGHYMGSYGLPVAIGDTKIGLSLWTESLLTDERTGRMDAEALNADGQTVTVPVGDGERHLCRDLRRGDRYLCAGVGQLYRRTGLHSGRWYDVDQDAGRYRGQNAG